MSSSLQYGKWFTAQIMSVLRWSNVEIVGLSGLWFGLFSLCTWIEKPEKVGWRALCYLIQHFVSHPGFILLSCSLVQIGSLLPLQKKKKRGCNEKHICLVYILQSGRIWSRTAFSNHMNTRVHLEEDQDYFAGTQRSVLICLKNCTQGEKTPGSYSNWWNTAYV